MQSLRLDSVLSKYWPTVAADVSVSEAAAAEELGQALRTDYHTLLET